MGEFDKNQNEGKFNQDEKGGKPAFGQFDKGQQDQQEFGQGKQQELTGAEGKTGQQQQGQGQEKGQQGDRDRQDKNDQQR